MFARTERAPSLFLFFLITSYNTCLQTTILAVLECVFFSLDLKIRVIGWGLISDSTWGLHWCNNLVAWLTTWVVINRHCLISFCCFFFFSSSFMILGCHAYYLQLLANPHSAVLVCLFLLCDFCCLFFLFVLHCLWLILVGQSYICKE